MKKLLIGFLVVVFLVGTLAQVTEAAKWKFHYYTLGGGTLTVWGTINCVPVGDPLFYGWGPYCNNVTGWLPPWCNDYLTRYAWDSTYYTCENIDWNKVAVKHYNDDLGIWELLPFAGWVETYVPDSVVLPTFGDSTGVIQYVHIVADLGEWLADPRPLQDEYDIIDGECSDLPGYLIGTTPITFDSLAGPGENPFQTTPLTGTLWRDGDVTFTPEVRPIPTLTEWGMIIFCVLLFGWMAWVIVRRRRRVTVGI